MSGNMCDTCVNYIYDEDDESWTCCVDMDEDDYVRMLTSPKPVCVFYRNDDEYAVVRHQM
ncbi:MAG: hypothetical protein J6D46_01425 [Lachnospiraceae bacterium]|nr:hypothetical protein [Lachnospiraceae bacterium]